MLLVTAGIRATPGILIVPLETEFGWSRTAISGAVAINIALFGLIGPFAASVMDRWGLRRRRPRRAGAAGGVGGVDDADAQRVAAGVAVGRAASAPAPASTSLVLAAVVATRWFEERRGLVMGALSAANATGQLVFLPMLARLRRRARLARGLCSSSPDVGGRRLRHRAVVHARSSAGSSGCGATANASPSAA